jgi:hypothetical protein
MAGMQLPEERQQRWLAALDVWERYPALGFVDSLIYVMAVDQDYELATFDNHFNRFSNVRFYWPGT